MQSILVPVQDLLRCIVAKGFSSVCDAKRLIDDDLMSWNSRGFSAKEMRSERLSTPVFMDRLLAAMNYILHFRATTTNINDVDRRNDSCEVGSTSSVYVFLELLPIPLVG